MSVDFASDLLVSVETAKANLNIQLAALDLVDGRSAEAELWFDQTIEVLEGIFATGARKYFESEGGFKFSYQMRVGRVFESANIERARGILKRIIEAIPQKKERVSTETPSAKSLRVFVVHGHDERRLLEVKEVISSQGLEPVILRDLPNGGKSIIEKFEAASDVGFAVILLTGDDIGKSKTDLMEQSRARQNVILELGYFVGKLSRSKVCALADDGVELPSDIHGVVYTKLDHGGVWKYKLLDELKFAGYKIDKNEL